MCDGLTSKCSSGSIGVRSPQGRFILGGYIVIYTHMSRFINYLKETRVEMRHVSWPTQKQALMYTGMVVGFSLVVAFVLGFADFVFSRGLDLFITKI